MNKTNLLLVSSIPPPNGGIATWTKLFMEVAEINDVKTTLLNTSLLGKRSKRITSKRNIFDEIKRTYYIFKNLNQLIRSNIFDVAHINTSCGKLGIIRDSFIASRLHKHTRVIFHFHCNIEDQIRTLTQKFFLKKILKISKSNIVLNDFSRKHLDTKYGVRSTIIPNFIKMKNDLNQIKNEKNTFSNILFVGHVQEAKGINIIFSVAQTFPNLNFILVGPVSETVKRNVNQKNIIFVGEVDKKDIHIYYENADVFLFPSKSEGFSLALLEAMSYGLPIITTRIGASEQMLEGKGGIFISNIGETINALHQISQIELRKYMSEWNVEKVRTCYTDNVVMKKLKSIYDSL